MAAGPEIPIEGFAAEPCARHAARRARSRHQDDRHRALRSGAPDRDAAPNNPPHEIRQGRGGAPAHLREGEGRRAGPRPADQHERHRGPARAGDARVPAQPRAADGPPGRALGRAALHGRRRARHDRGRHVAQEARREDRRCRRSLHPAGRARPAGSASEHDRRKVAHCVATCRARRSGHDIRPGSEEWTRDRSLPGHRSCRPTSRLRTARWPQSATASTGATAATSKG